jgi:hypothetical protein
VKQLRFLIEDTCYEQRLKKKAGDGYGKVDGKRKQEFHGRSPLEIQGTFLL